MPDPDKPPRTYFDALFSRMQHAAVQAYADRAFAQLVLESMPDSSSGRGHPAAKPAGAAPPHVLRILLSCARSRGIAPDGATSAREEARRQLAEGRYILWPPEG